MLPASEAQAAIYVDDHNDICVVNRSGFKELLQVSPYSKLLDQCVVYLYVSRRVLPDERRFGAQTRLNFRKSADNGSP